MDTRGEGVGVSSSVLLTKICPQRVITCFRSSPKVTTRSYQFSVWEQVFPIPPIIRFNCDGDLP